MGKIVPIRPRPVLFYAGHIKPTRRRQPKPCSRSWHAGPIRTDPDALFAETGECACCGLLIHRSQVRVPA